MMNSYLAKVVEGDIKIPESVELPEGARLLITVVPDSDSDEQTFWYAVSQHAFSTIWNNSDDDIYAQLR